jgi:diacylglycerol O-acyltransferase
MRRMDGLSAFMLQQERAGTYMHTLKISILDVTEIPGGWSFDRFCSSVARRLHTLPMFRWKFLRVPFGLHHPVWVDDPEFDLNYHLRRVACPAPGDRKAFSALVSQLYAWKLDMNRPLWVCWAVEGLEDGSVALITLMHHAYTDGAGAARLLSQFYTQMPECSEPEPVPWTPEPTPGPLALLGRALVDLPLTLLRSAPEIGRGIVNLRRMRRRFRASGKSLPPSVWQDRRDSPFNIMLSQRRTFVFETFDLEEIRALGKGFGVTINDLFVAVAAGAYRRFMASRGFDPDAAPLVTAIPVSKRPPLAEDDCIGNKTSADYLSMPVQLSDPEARLEAAHVAGNIMKEHIAASEGVDLSTLLEITPPVLLRLLDWVVKRKQGRFGIWGNAALSNVPGPKQPLYMGHAKLSNWISMGQIFHGLGLNTTVWSYNGQFNLCILADQKLLPDGWELVGFFREAFAEYRAILDKDKRATVGDAIPATAIGQ